MMIPFDRVQSAQKWVDENAAGRCGVQQFNALLEMHPRVPGDMRLIDNTDMVYLDLFHFISGAPMTHYCSEQYWLWEDAVAKPQLTALGYERITFHMSERDSFGPLSRIARAYKGG